MDVSAPEFRVEFNYGNNITANGTVDAISIRSNAGDGAMMARQAACQALDVRLLDNQTSDFADFGPGTASSMRGFVEFRERNLGRAL